MGRDDEDAAAPDDDAVDRDAEGDVTDDGASDREEAPDPLIGRGFFGEDIGPGSSMAHLYRGEIHRMTLWRERLDRTTNWAVIVIAAVLTWAFSAESNPHYVILVGVAVLGIFCGIESLRYRGYDIWRSRVRTIQVNAFAYALDPRQGVEEPDWREKLARDYRRPAIKITWEEAIAHRLRRVYLALGLVLLAAWIFRITAFAHVPWPASAAVGQVPGMVVTAVVAGCYLAAIAVAFRPRTWRARGELREEDLRDA
ncbi:MAG TPA: DUF2270 domain-containing protein [Halobacteriales archaeon]|nr:DUF2270 domain-containing protein [Halobacteriales archaeon]